jgi:ketosteroid isomerase-like protein
MTPTRLSRLESTTRLVLEFNDAFNRHDVTHMMQLMSEDCVFENTTPFPDGTIYTGKEAVTQFWLDFFHNSPNAQIEIEDIFGLGMHCIMLWRYSWMDTDGNKGHVRGVDIFKVSNGLITEKLSYVKG